MDTVERIKQQIAGNPILLYMKGTPDFPQCGFSSLATQLLRTCGAKFETVNILEEPDIRRTLPQVANWPTFPQLYINGELIGGSDIMKELYERGELQKLVAGAKPAA
ncbi:MAG: monothiol glutaredoxin [Gammaproteobacteria bacterium]|nr:MAG: monothiol glutaredoxin [Gammaproteobacteria bacterium]TND04490.1 MAG: monothiol glutaredoxin [Gammaproteobacteria bacterium]